MLKIRRAQEGGHSSLGWLGNHHTFSFSSYYAQGHMGFSSLCVINDDTVASGKRSATNGHNGMKNISHMLDGGLEHKESMGYGSVIRPGDVRCMSAGTGVTLGGRA